MQDELFIVKSGVIYITLINQFHMTNIILLLTYRLCQIKEKLLNHYENNARM